LAKASSSALNSDIVDVVGWPASSSAIRCTLSAPAGNRVRSPLRVAGSSVGEPATTVARTGSAAAAPPAAGFAWASKSGIGSSDQRCDGQNTPTSPTLTGRSVRAWSSWPASVVKKAV
jgi:hypothetical protein